MLVKNAQSASATERDPRWTSVVARNAEADGPFEQLVASVVVFFEAPALGLDLPLDNPEHNLPAPRLASLENDSN